MMIVLRTHGGLGNQISTCPGWRWQRPCKPRLKNIEPWLKQPKENGLIEFRGATKQVITMRQLPSLRNLKVNNKE